MKSAPNGIKLYLARLEGHQRADGYVCIDDSNTVIASEGWVGNTNLDRINRDSDLLLSLPILEGLLPASKKSPTVISNVHIDKEHYFDVHIFYSGYVMCVLFIDKTRTAKLLQKEQQIRLSDDIVNEKKSQGGNNG